MRYVSRFRPFNASFPLDPLLGKSPAEMRVDVMRVDVMRVDVVRVVVSEAIPVEMPPPISL